MKKRDLLNKITEIAKRNQVTLEFLGGTKHDKFRINGAMILVPRHSEVNEHVARTILKQCEAAVADGRNQKRDH